MKLVASPLLEPADIEALQRGYEVRENLVERAVLRQLGEEFLQGLSGATRLRLECLAWLIADERLDIKVALPSSSAFGNGQAIYHEKIGMFFDNDGNVVAFTGSPNETVGGLVSNFESIDVYMSWDDPQGRVARKTANFERLWANNTPRLEVFEFPVAARKKLLEFRSGQRPKFDFDEKGADTVQRVMETQLPYTVPAFRAPDTLTLYPHQVAAIEAWNSTENAGPQARRAGFLEMATGAGKTITALSIAARLYGELGRLAVIVVAPTKILVDQWSEEAERFGLSPIRAHSDYPAWRNEAWSSARAYRRRHFDRAIVVVTNASFATPDFQQLIAEFQGPLLLIADEAHNLGTTRTIEYLPAQVEYRLALSATPRRHFDEKGTQLLFDYFGETVYEFTLKDAIGVCLTPYDYFITPVELTRTEMDQYRSLTVRIGRLLGAGRNKEEDDPRVERLLIERAKIVSSAEAKGDVLSRLLDEVDLKELKHTFVYASDKDPEQTAEIVRLLQDEKRLLVHQFTDQETRDNKLRQDLLRRFANGDDLQVLVAKRCLDEGVDIPPTRRAYFLASTTNPRQYIQRRGRLLRRFPGKDHAIIHDLIVTPPEGSESPSDETERNVLTSELLRVIEFASAARNGATARLSILHIAKRYDVVDILAQGGT
jgi:superfamily II DNA or RNA helicase